MRTIKYLLFNGTIVTLMFIGYFYTDAKPLVSFLLTCYYFFSVVVHLILNIAHNNEDIKKSLLKASLAPRHLLEPIYPVVAFYTGYNLVGVLAFIEFIGFVFLRINIYNMKQDSKQ